jgi:hypothetical protein
MTMVRRIASMLVVALLSGGGFVSAVQAPGACSETSRLARQACDAGVADDFWIAKGICKNIADAAERQQCLVDAREARTEAQQECRDQFHARQDLCSDLGQAPYDPAIDPADFLSPQETAMNPNPYFPLVPGTTRIFQGAGETVTVTVTNQTKTIQGGTTIVVQDDVVDDSGRLVETTLGLLRAEGRHYRVVFRRDHAEHLRRRADQYRRILPRRSRRREGRDHHGADRRSETSTARSSHSAMQRTRRR